jgi:hypothetical protein
MELAELVDGIGGRLAWVLEKRSFAPLFCEIGARPPMPSTNSARIISGGQAPLPPDAAGDFADSAELGGLLVRRQRVAGFA